MTVATGRSVARRIATAAGLGALVLAPLALHWLRGNTLVCFDTQKLYAPQRWLVDEALRAFRLPLWNPFLGGGMPFLADLIHGVLHPASILTAWLGTGRSADALIGFHVLAAGLGSGLLARDLGASRAGAAVAAVSYALSGYVLSMTGNLVFLAGAGSLPFAVAGLRRFAVAPGPGHLAFGALGTAMLALSGDAQALAIGAAMALALSATDAGWRGAARAFAASGLGALCAGVQLLPSAYHLAQSVRSAGEWSADPAVWALEPWRLPELVVPGLFRGAEPVADPLFGAFAPASHLPPNNFPFPFAQGVSIGLVPLLLAAAGLREGRRGRVLGVLALLLLWGALGPLLGAGQLLAHVPVWGSFRYAEKLVGPMTLAVGLLAALGLDGLSVRRAAAWKELGLVGALAVAAIAAFHLRTRALSPELAAMAAARTLRGGAHLLGATVAVAAWLALRLRLGPDRARAALAGVTWCGAVAASTLALHPGAPDARLRAPGPVLEAPAPGPRIVTPIEYVPVLHGPDVDWYDDLGREHAALGYPAYNVRHRFDSLNADSGLIPARQARVRVAFGDRWGVVARRFAITHLILEPPAAQADRVALAPLIDGALLVGSIPGREAWAVPHREWAAFAPEVQVAEGEEAALGALGRAFMEGSSRVVLEGRGPFGVAPGRVLSVQRGLESLRVEAEADGEGTLVVADSWWPGWEARIDGEPTPIFPADVLARAVRWPAGRHVLEMNYRPWEVRAGLVASAAGLLLLAAACAWLRRRRPSCSRGR